MVNKIMTPLNVGWNPIPFLELHHRSVNHFIGLVNVPGLALHFCLSKVLRRLGSSTESLLPFV